uniref:Cytochrome c oxidase subunit 3 n=1 Tax=Triaenodes qinglingensis TaxID=2904906 RepID=A0A9E8LQ91_9NEOP|nr:cytochrome c oxidase subunit III [Triaenodes qinglingensis]UZZ44434.1 cytochrome c oxidase subunit III [Triaenodes qinglingensis]
MKLHSNHPYHLVDYSPWPLMSSFSVMMMMTAIIKWFHNYSMSMFMISLPLMILCMYQWWRDIIRESSYQGLHSKEVITNMKWGMILFIVSEVFFFLSFFWSFFHSYLSPTMELGSLWPPKGINPFNAFQIPLLNTIILLTSGIAVTWSHHSMIKNNYTQSYNSLLLCIILGIYFTMLQAYEYIEASFTISDSVFGSVFFIATGFHGLHVIIGTLFLIICLIRFSKKNFSSYHHFGFEAAAWYWHFVDIVWLFLYTLIYWWSS